MYGMSRNQGHSEIKRAQQELAENDTAGVKIPQDIALPAPDSTLASDDLWYQSAVHRIDKYSADYAQACVNECCESDEHSHMFGSLLPIGFSQLSHIAGDDDLGDSISDAGHCSDSGNWERRLEAHSADEHMFEKSDTYNALKFRFTDAASAIDCLDNKLPFQQRLNQFLANYHLGFG